MGNVCCGYDEEDYKKGPWYSVREPNDDDAEAENRNGSSFNEEDDDALYNADATNREQLILHHEKTRRWSDFAARGSNGQGGNNLTRLKRPSIMCTPMEMTPSFSFTPPSFPKSPETKEFLLSVLADHFLFVFASIDEETKLQFVDAMQSQEFDEGDWVMHQGDVGDYFYIVEDGEVAFHVGEGCQLVGTGTKGTTFGELALIYNTPRAASVRASAHLKLHKIDQLTFRSLLMSRHLSDRSNIISLVKKSPIFQDLDEATLNKLVDAFTIVEFDQGERIVNKGDPGDVFYIVKSGLVKEHNIGHGNSKFQDQMLGEGNSFGEGALIAGETRAADVTAVAQSSFLAISKQVLENIIGPLEQAIVQTIRSKYLRAIPIFEHLERDQIDRCVMRLKEERFAKREKILAKGKLYLIQEGRALITLQEKAKNIENCQNESGSYRRPKRKESTVEPILVKLEKGDYFGDLWGSSEHTINVESDMTCLTLLDSDVQYILGEKRMSMLNFDPDTLKEHGNGRPMKSRWSYLKHMGSRSSSSDYIKRKRSSTNLDMLDLSKLKQHRILGVGSFGKVWLVTPKSNTKDEPTPYALKTISKRQLLKQKMILSVLREKNVMESVDHPFLLHMVSSFQDENYLYFVMGLILGGELFELLYASDKKANNDNPAWKESAFYKSFGAEDEERSQGLAGVGVRKAVFYGACVIDAFAYLHNRRIAYRDLKPENVMLNEKGYCVIVDMGFAKVVLDKTYTVCGTLEYLAPEVIVNKGHNHVADYWSIACLLYELIVGQTPFFQPGIDQISMLKKIAMAKYVFPDEITKLNPGSSNGLDNSLCDWKDLISRLLKPKTVERLGNLRNGMGDILYHDWFANIDFNEFRHQGTPAPWIPTIVDPLVTSHFGNKFARQERPEVFAREISAKDQDVFSRF